MTIREYMAARDENIGWCTPYIGKRVACAIVGDEIISLSIDGQEVPQVADDASPGRCIVPLDEVERAARIANPEFDLYKGWSLAHIIAEGDVTACPCHECPWFDVCAAMDEDIDSATLGQDADGTER